MKKLVAMLVTASLLLSLAACAGSSEQDSSSTPETEQVTTTEAETEAETEEETTTEAEATTAAEEDTTAEAEPETTPEDEPDSTEGEGDASQEDSPALAILNTVWGSYSNDEKFPVFGGDLSEDSLNMEGPGVYTLGDPEIMDGALGFPAASADLIDGAASLTNMLNANTFTCGAYHLTDASQMDALTETVKNNILARQWMCGFPEKVVIVTVDDCMVAIFGHEEPIDTFIGKLTAAYASAQIVVDEPIM